ncbi:MAG: baseplate J/gp47 family protein [Desulfovibrio sp.]|nr:baseplate J/gp47 family protein [Desulfovibrio sp.]
MPFDRPDLTTLIERAQADMDSRLDGAPWLRRRLLAVLARMQGGVAHGLYGYLDWQALQLMPDTAEAEHLARWASIWGVSRKGAARATGYAVFPASAGAVLPAGTELLRPDGVRYLTLADVFAVAGKARVAIEASEAGLAGNAGEDTPLQLAAPVLGLEAGGASDGDITGGAEEEGDASLRARLLARIRNQPSGGAARDYVAWALEVAGVTRAWCFPGEMGRGSVTVRFMMDDTYADGIPHADDVARVREHIEGLRPVTADVYVVAPVPAPIDLDLRISPDTPRLRATVERAVWAQLRREAEPGGVVVVSRLNEAISLAEGEEDHVLLAPAANLYMGTGRIAVPGKITWADADE